MNMAQETNYPKNFKFEEIQNKWIQNWEKEKLYEFNINENGRIFSIDTPPPFVSGVLHIGQYLNYAWIDFVARFRRMRGENVYFPQGWDCHGLPVELAVTKNYKVKKDNRELFLQKCREWVEKNIINMTRQLDILGYSTDWKYTYRTMNDSYKYKVQFSLLYFFNKGWLYREKFPTHFCVNCETSLAKAEVSYEEEDGKLWFIKLPLAERENEYVTIATTRPEYMEACVGILINPNDDRYYDLSAAEVNIPFTNRKVRIYLDSSVDINFGTGIVYICTYGDEMDIKWKIQFDLEEIQIFTEDGHLNENSKYKGLTIPEAREQIVKDLDKMGLLVKVEDYTHNVIIHSERSSCRKPIEYLPVYQWFINVKDFINEILEAGEVMKWYPEKQKQRLVDWAKGLDWNWVISRQRVFGTPIPFWYCEECGEVIAPKKEDLPIDPVKQPSTVKKCLKCGSSKIVGEKDVCDCWIDSSITPLAISKWEENPDFFRKIYTEARMHRPQGYEIIRTWLFYTLFRCKMLTGKPPFDEVMINGMVAGPDGRHMSKSLGNYISPDEVVPQYGSDAIRYWTAMGSLGDDYPFEFTWINIQNKEPVSNEVIMKEMQNMPEDKFNKKYKRRYEQLIGASRLITKIWNAYRFLYLNLEKIKISELNYKARELSAIDCYYYSEFNKNLEIITNYFEGYNWHEGVMVLRTFFWNDLCDNYIEAIKYKFYLEDESIKKTALKNGLILFYNTLKLFSIIMPFITEEVYHILYKPFLGLKSIHLEKWADPFPGVDENLVPCGKLGVEIIKNIRNIKSTLKMPLNQEISKIIILSNKENEKFLETLKPDISNTLRINELMILPKNKSKSIKEKPDLMEDYKDLGLSIYFFK